MLCCVLCCVVWCVARLGTQKKPPCVDSKRPRVYRLHTEVFETDTRGRGGVKGGKGEGGHCQFC